MIKYVKGDVNLIILGDWYARIEQRKDGMIAGIYGPGGRNERGERLIEF
jgi:hypothetical protein